MDKTTNILDLNDYCYIEIFSSLEKMDDKLNFKMAHPKFSAVFAYNVDYSEKHFSITKLRYLLEFCGRGRSVGAKHLGPCSQGCVICPWKRFDDHDRYLCLINKYCDNVKDIYIGFCGPNSYLYHDGMLMELPRTKILQLRYSDFLNDTKHKFNLRIFADKYGKGLQVLELCDCTIDEQSLLRLTSLKVLCCPLWIKKFQPQFEKLEYLAFHFPPAPDNFRNYYDCKNVLNHCKNLKCLQLHLNFNKDSSSRLRIEKFHFITDFISSFLEKLRDRGDTGKDPFVLLVIYWFDTPTRERIQKKLDDHPHGKLLKLEWNGDFFNDRISSIKSNVIEQ